MHESQEVLDLVDIDDRVIGTVLRGEFDHYAYRNGYVRASEAFIVNSRGEFWVPRRSPHKTHVPNGLDFSVSEHVSSGETYDAAIVRGFHEELNLNIAVNQLKHVGIVPPTDTMPWFSAIYIYASDEAPQFNMADFSEASWIKPADLLEQILAGESAKSGLPPAVQFVLPHILSSL